MQQLGTRSEARKKQVEENGNGPTVNFEEFEEWFKSRTGDDDAVLPVLPEYMVAKITHMAPQLSTHDLAAAKLANAGGFFGKRTRSGKDLWAFLRPRLGLLVKVQRQVRRPLRPFRRPLSLRFTYATSVLVKKY
jgi:hypothetical protein